MSAGATDVSERSRWQRVVAALRIGRVDPQQQSLFEFRRIWIVAPWAAGEGVDVGLGPTVELERR